MTGEMEEIAVAALVRDGSVLLVHRHPDRRWYPNCWDLAGGHIEPGETPEEAIRRECLEELGVILREFQPIALRVADPHLEMHGFLVTAWDGHPSNLELEEHDDLRWFEAGQLPTLKMADPGSKADLIAAMTRRYPQPRAR